MLLLPWLRHKLIQKGLGKARMAVTRKLEIRLWIMLRDQIDYQSSVAGDRCVRTTAMPVRGCLKRALVPSVTGRLIRLPASLKA
jgi:hypothetical protein